MSRVVLAMSGGVDSSVAAHLLLETGHEVVGVFMRHGEQSPVTCELSEGGSSLPILSERADHKQGCCGVRDAEDARRVAQRYGIPFYALNLQAEFGRIIDYFVDEYTAGRTPNPCVMCNNWLKFGKLFEYADSIDAEYVATGHYAQLSGSASDVPALLSGVDKSKDQSYVLFGVQRELLSRMLLPVGSFQKSQIREIAIEQGLGVAEKKDSQEICFVTSGKHDEFVRHRRGDVDRSGAIVTTDGTIVGHHPGIERFTVGQRKGLGVAMGEPHFVVRIEPESHNVVIGQKSDLERTELTARHTNWLVESPASEFRCTAQIRYNSEAHPAQATLLDENRLHVAFDAPLVGVAPGQAVVCYEGDRVLGGGWIE